MLKTDPVWNGDNSGRIGFRDLLLGGLLLCAVLVFYQPAIHGGLVFDDDRHITPETLRSLHGLWRIWFEIGAGFQYYPVLHTAFWVEHRLWGDTLAGYHLLNLFLHTGAAFLVVAIMRRLSLPGAFCAASRLRGIGGLDFGTEEHPFHGPLSRVGSGLPAL